jgi:hypothetical protein
MTYGPNAELSSVGHVLGPIIKVIPYRRLVHRVSRLPDTNITNLH